ncbi:MAG TPA: PIN domain-containing protein [Chitinophagaceae bacterium]|nr:PIN domain-containing protein [Chitinophagaceae bacterium]
MRKLFIDTNIIIDLLGDRRPHSKFAASIFNKAELGEIKLYVSSLSFATTHYILKKNIGDKKLRTVLYTLLDYLNIIPIDSHILKRGLKSSYKDFEDGLQIIAASSVNEIDAIITRNIKDFKESEIPAYPPDAILDKL